MLEHIPLLQEALIEEFYALYDQYHDDDIYACALVFNEYLVLDCLAVSTTRSLFSEHEDPAQYLSEHDQWDVSKWRYRSSYSSESRFTQFKLLLADYLKTTHIFGNQLLEQHTYGQTTLELIITAFKQAKEACTDSYGLNTHSVVFFISLPQQPKVAVHSAECLNKSSPLLNEFLRHYALHTLPQHPKSKLKLSQTEKDLLVDLAQMVEIEPYDYLHISQQAYLLTLESTFMDSNPYIQKLVQTIAAMDTGMQNGCALEKNEILERIEQFYHANHNPTLLDNDHFSNLS